MEGAGPGVDIANQIASARRWGVVVGFNLLTQGGVGLQAPPSLRKGDEETLFARQSVSDDIAPAAQGSLVTLELQDPMPPIALRLTTLRPPQAGSPLDDLIAQIREARG